MKTGLCGIALTLNLKYLIWITVQSAFNVLKIYNIHTVISIAVIYSSLLRYTQRNLKYKNCTNIKTLTY